MIIGDPFEPPCTLPIAAEASAQTEPIAGKDHYCHATPPCRCHEVSRPAGAPAISTVNALSSIGQMIGEPTRAAMLVALMDGRALTASELAQAGGVTASTASGHLSAMLAAQLLKVVQQGRHRYFRLASADIASMIETMMRVASHETFSRPIRVGPRDRALRLARTCYDHLAGSVAVAIADVLQARGELDLSVEGAALDARGLERLAAMGVRIPDGPAGARPDRGCADRASIGASVGRTLAALSADPCWRCWLPGTGCADRREPARC